MTETEVSTIAIGSDAPLTDPAHDAFGYAPFARHIADAVRKTQSPQGLVMAIHGSWGVGKSTLLNFVKHDLAHLPIGDQPIVIDFNPWWFNSREHLATQFLIQFRAKLPHESEILRAIGDKMADYGAAIGTTIAKAYGIPWLDKPIALVLKLFKKTPKDVPSLKTEISEALKKAGQRFVFIVDDIDRLAPDEIRELFKVIKALADFPNVIYLLSFDRKVVADALRASLGVEGEAYIEEIVQAPFSLPAVDRLRLRHKLFTELDRILEPSRSAALDQTYWGNVYFDGLDHYIRKPRDIVRIVNSLGVLYPSMAGEVDTVDFIAIEFLRVFEPEVYGIVWAQKDMFVGHSDRGYRHDNEPDRRFHDAWLERVPAERRPHVKKLVVRLFPRLENVWGNTSYGSESAARWRKELRICSPDIVDVYFQFGLSPEALSRTEINQLIAAAIHPEQAVAILVSASAIRSFTGSSRAREYLDRLRDLEDEIAPEAAFGLLVALFQVGDVLLSPEDEQGGMTAIPNRWRLMWTINHLLNRIPLEQHSSLLDEEMARGKAVGLLTYITAAIEEYLAKPDTQRDEPLAQIKAAELEKLRSAVLARLSSLDQQQLLAIPDLDVVIHHWIRWAGKEVVAARLNPILDSEMHLPLFLEKYLRFGTQHGWDDRVARRVPRLNPKHLEPLTDISVMEPRIEKMLGRADLSVNQRIAGERFIKGMEMIRQGKDPDGFFQHD